MEEDVRRVVQIVNWAAAETTANFATEPEALHDWLGEWQRTRDAYPWVVALHEGSVVAFAKAGPHRSRGAYAWTAETSVYVDPAHHGRGIAAALYTVLLPLLRQQGFVTLLAGITAGHVASERLHEKFGFVRCASFHRVGWKFEAWHDVSYWELSLREAEGPPPKLRSVADVWTEPP